MTSRNQREGSYQQRRCWYLDSANTRNNRKARQRVWRRYGIRNTTARLPSRKEQALEALAAAQMVQEHNFYMDHGYAMPCNIHPAELEYDRRHGG